MSKDSNCQQTALFGNAGFCRQVTINVTNHTSDKISIAVLAFADKFSEILCLAKVSN